MGARQALMRPQDIAVACVLAGAIVLGEHLSLWAGLGGIVVLAGLAVAVTQPKPA
jgi:drug/metabolite transporter (DMT)-like permease